MKSEKLALSVALIASILALVISIFNFLDLPSKPVSTPPSGGGMRGGGMRSGSGYSSSEEYLAKHQEKVNLLMKILFTFETQFKAGSITSEALLEQRCEIDEARIAFLKIKEGRRPIQGFSEAFVKVKMLRELEKEVAEKSPEELKIAKIRLLNAEIRLLEVSRRIDGETIQKADELIKDYSAQLTDEQLMELIALEPVRGGRG